MDKNLNKDRSLLICLALIFAVAIVYWRVCTYGFVNYDDQSYVYENQSIRAGITLETIKSAFTLGYAGQGHWQPLTWLSYMLDWQFFGSDAGGYHLTNLIFHIANTLLLFLALKRMTNAIWQSAFVAALFALHPLHVESVAWVSGRKDVLSTFFWLLAMWAYLRYVKHPNVTRYLLTLLMFALGLMAKSMLVTLPFVFLLLDYWPFDRIPRIQLRILYRLVLEKIPFIILAALFSVITFVTQRSLGLLPKFTRFSLKFRIYNALISYVEYIEKMFWPNRLAVFYPHPFANVSVLYAVISAILLLAVTILVIRFSQNRRYLVTGWFWYFGTLLPVIGLVQLGGQAMADRYSYITLTGLFIIIAWGVSELFAKFRHKKIVLTQLALLTILAMSICTCFQIRYWRNSLTLFQHALDVTKNNYLAHCLITEPLLMQNKTDEAIYHYSQAIRIKPDYTDALNGLGVALHEAGRVDEAVVYYKKAIEIDPCAPEANANLGVAIASKGQFNEAVEHYEIAMKAIDTPSLHRNYAEALFNLGRFQEAVAQYRKVLLTMPNDPNVINELGYVLAHTGKFDEAITLYNQALQISPDRVDIHLNLGTALTSSGKFEEAKKEYEKILLLQPQNAVAHNDFGAVLYRLGKLDDAVAQFRQAVQINPQYTDAKNNLSAVSAEKQKSNNNAAESNKKINSND